MEKKIRFENISQFTGVPNYRVAVPWKSLERSLDEYNVDLDPDFQRGHVWTPEQQTAYIEFCLRGGMTGHEVYLNNPIMHFGSQAGQDVSVLVDGKQRISAVLKFLHDEVPIFGGHICSQVEGLPRMDPRVQFTFSINTLQTRAEVLTWYLELNSGGVVHSREELDRVAGLLEEARTAGI